MDESPKPDPRELLGLMKWHLERYDRLRVSAVTRAAVVLSASAILSTGDAVILARLLGATGSSDIGGWPKALLGTGLAASAILVVIVLLRASSVLVALRGSRSLFPEDVGLPSGFLFNGRDTLDQAKTFRDFRAAINAQDYVTMIKSAQVELWIVIKQHRRRYTRLRGAVLLLSLSAIIFLISFVGLVIAVVAVA
jgi:hypothetical protein